MEQELTRATVDPKYTWDTSRIYENDEAWEKAVEAVKAQGDAFAAMAGTLSQGKEVILKALTDNPRERFGLPKVDLASGEAQDFAIFDLDREYTVDPETFVSMGHATPFAGWQVQGECVYTCVGGETVWQKK